MVCRQRGEEKMAGTGGGETTYNIIVIIFSIDIDMIHHRQ